LLKIHAPVSFGSQRLTHAIAGYLHLYPETTIDLTLSDRHSDTPIDVVEEGYDAAIMIGPLADSELIARSLQPYTMWLCASPDYLKRMGTPQVPRDLVNHNCLALSHWRRKKLWRLCDQDKSQDIPVDGQFVANNGQSLKVAALAGLGIIMQPEILVSDDVVAGRLVRILANYEAPLRPMYIVHADRRPTAKLRTFIDYVIKQFG
jgi:DNA-binding transcriptional LysR family regulator